MPKRRQRPTTTLFPPGAPLVPIPGLTPPDGSPRQWAYPVGYNIGQRPRATEQTSFEQLRNLAAIYDGIQIWIRSLQRTDTDKPTLFCLLPAIGEHYAERRQERMARLDAHQRLRD
jgi:hypothetical protein